MNDPKLGDLRPLKGAGRLKTGPKGFQAVFNRLEAPFKGSRFFA